MLASGGGGGATGLAGEASSGFALQTQGKVTFDTAGILKIPKGKDRRTADPGVPVDTDTRVLATMVDSTGAGVTIAQVRRIKNQNRIQVILTGPAARRVHVAWFVIN